MVYICSIMESTKTTNGLPSNHDQTFANELKKSGADKTLHKLFDRYWKPLFQFSFNILRDDDDAKDVVQEVFISLWDRKLDLAVHSSIESYLFTSVRYKSLTKLSQRLSSSERNLPLENYVEQTFSDALDPLLMKELQQEIDLQINKLPDRMQEVIRLKTKECLSIQEIAEKLNISEDTVKNHLATARKRLRVQLRDVAYTAFIISTYTPLS
ncbi:hypothetical protein C5745_06070 [Sphingobacterium haloxyli]|uniref:HTH luxR-type domain-containing protein n=2 Tax=Sphingobacterium haloxyli TaxID=2100533 RepID=A0A2S9J5R5_9SPHI|nr:hypothetical protein C5745_06070 [Sphingobacterium haloxyli]